jgi:hypothetical protein
MQPTLSIYVAPTALYGAVVSTGTKGLRLDALAVVPRSDPGELPLEVLRNQIGSVAWSELALAVENAQPLVAAFPIEREQSEVVVREQLELEIVQQFLSTPSEGYTADVYRVGPDAEGRFTACAVCWLRSHDQIFGATEEVFGIQPRKTLAVLGAAAAYAYNYPQHASKRVGIALVGDKLLDFIVMHNGALLYWAWTPIERSIEQTLQHAVRSALFHCGEVATIRLTGSALTRQSYQRLAIAFDGRLSEPIAPLDGFRLVECGMNAHLCRAAAPLGHLFAPALGAAIAPLYLPAHWTIALMTDTAV